jgi:hypothetical protein
MFLNTLLRFRLGGLANSASPRTLFRHWNGILHQISACVRVNFCTRVSLASFQPGFWRQMPRPPTALTGVTPIRLFAIA